MPQLARRFLKLVAILFAMFPAFLCVWPADCSGAGTCSSATTIGLVFASGRDVRHSMLELAVIGSGPPDPRLAEAPTTRIGFALSGFGTLVRIPARITPNHAPGDDSNPHQFLITSAPVMSRQKGTIN
jgi:hypothetical protein